MQPDVIVLGAGPAGVAVSSVLARNGYSVEAYDPATFPRSKICGEFLNPQAVDWLAQRGLLERLLSLDPFPVYGMKISDLDGRSFSGEYDADQRKHIGFVVLRKSFDSLLVGIAREEGIKIHEGWTPCRLLFDGERVVGIAGKDAEGNSFERRARIVIGADGRNNLIGRSFGWVRGIRKLRKYAFQTYFENLPDLSSYGEVHLVPTGYIGIAPVHATLANVALVIDERFHPGDADPTEFLLKAIHESSLAPRFANLAPAAPVFTAGPLAFEMARVSGHGTVLVGDTCGFIDPFTGEGINYGFVSAGLAGRVLKEAFDSNNFSDQKLSEYDGLRKKHLGKKLSISKLLQQAIARPSLSAFLVSRFRKREDLANLMVSAVGSAIPVESVWNLRFVLRLLF